MKRKRITALVLAAVMASSLAACKENTKDESSLKPRPENESQNYNTDGQDTKESSENEADNMTSDKKAVENTGLQMKIGDTPVLVEWEDNESVNALKELVKEKPLNIDMSMYGGFEQVGSIGTDLPRNDEQTTTKSGDVVLYSGNQIVVFYGSNSWAYTYLGHITDRKEVEMAELLGNGDTLLCLSAK